MKEMLALSKQLESDRSDMSQHLLRETIRALMHAEADSFVTLSVMHAAASAVTHAAAIGRGHAILAWGQSTFFDVNAVKDKSRPVLHRPRQHDFANEVAVISEADQELLAFDSFFKQR